MLYQGTTSQFAEKLRMEGEWAKFWRYKTINQGSPIVPGSSWRDPFFALFKKSSFSASCEVMPRYKSKIIAGDAGVADETQPQVLRRSAPQDDIV